MVLLPGRCFLRERLLTLWQVTPVSVTPVLQTTDGCATRKVWHEMVTAHSLNCNTFVSDSSVTDSWQFHHQKGEAWDSDYSPVTCCTWVSQYCVTGCWWFHHTRKWEGNSSFSVPTTPLSGANQKIHLHQPHQRYGQLMSHYQFELHFCQPHQHCR